MPTTAVRSYDSLGTTTRDLVRKKAQDTVSLASRLTDLKRRGKLRGKKLKVKGKFSVSVEEKGHGGSRRQAQ